MGDLVQTLPLLQRLETGTREREITVVCLREFRVILEGQPWHDRLIAVELAEVRKLCDNTPRQDSQRWLPFKDCPELAESYDHVVNLTHDEASAVLCEKIAASQKSGRIHTLPNEIRLRGDWAKYLFAAVRNRRQNLFNLVDIYLGMGRCLGLPNLRMAHEPGRDGFHSVPDFFAPSTKTDSRDAVERIPTQFMGSSQELTGRVGPRAAWLDFKVEAAAETEARTLLRQHGSAGKGLLVGLQMGASDLRRAWPIENFASLSRLLGVNPGLEIVLFGNPKEAELGKEFLRLANGPVVNLIGRTEVRQLPPLLKACDLLISNDTGPIHIAAAVGTRVLGLYFSTAYFAETAPYGEGHVVLQAEREPTQTKSPEFAAASANLLPVETVAAAALKMMGVASDWPSPRPGLGLYEARLLSNGTLIYAPAGETAAQQEYLAALTNRLMWEQAFELETDTAFVTELFSRSQALQGFQDQLADYRQALQRMRCSFSNGVALARQMMEAAASGTSGADPAAALHDRLAQTVKEISGLGERFGLLADFFHYEIMDLDFLPRPALAQELARKFKKLEQLSQNFLETLDRITGLAS
ncbi:MAG: hypothetical protein FJ398_13585 [Verrucomicrobia bacterium]|nr:hypothetical protein [Verrucomicrobiota bacterium]